MERNEDDRPVHLDYNVAAGAVTHTPVTDAEWDELDARTEAAVQAERKQQAEREQLVQAVADHPDPVVQAMARIVGLT